MTIDVRLGDVFVQPVDAIVHPTNSFCKFVTTLSLALRERAGEEMEKELLDVAPFAVGAAVVTKAGNLPQSWIIHVPVCDEPGHRVHAENVRRATRAALLAAHRKGIESMAMTALVTEKGGVAIDATARAMFDELRVHKHVRPSLIVAVDMDPVVVENFRLVGGGR